MDLREIHALHAQYTAQPVIIDIASHTAAMPALPAPDRGPTARARAIEFAGGLRKARKPALIALAIAVVAAGGGMSIARIWHAMHETVVAPNASVASVSRQVPASVLASEPNGEMPIDVNPARPLTSSDFDARRPVAQSALAKVDARSLAAPALNPTGAETVHPARPAGENVVAAASPIRAPRQSPPVAPVSEVATQSSPAAPTNPPATAEPQARTQSAQLPAATPTTTQAKPAATAAPEAPKPETRAALRPLHHVTHRAAAAANSDASPEPAAPAQPKAQPAKSGDVQLF